MVAGDQSYVANLWTQESTEKFLLDPETIENTARDLVSRVDLTDEAVINAAVDTKFRRFKEQLKTEGMGISRAVEKDFKSSLKARLSSTPPGGLGADTTQMEALGAPHAIVPVARELQAAVSSTIAPSLNLSLLEQEQRHASIREYVLEPAAAGASSLIQQPQLGNNLVTQDLSNIAASIDISWDATTGPGKQKTPVYAPLHIKQREVQRNAKLEREAAQAGYLTQDPQELLALRAVSFFQETPLPEEPGWFDRTLSATFGFGGRTFLSDASEEKVAIFKLIKEAVDGLTHTQVLEMFAGTGAPGLSIGTTGTSSAISSDPNPYADATLAELVLPEHSTQDLEDARDLINERLEALTTSAEDPSLYGDTLITPDNETATFNRSFIAEQETKSATQLKLINDAIAENEAGLFQHYGAGFEIYRVIAMGKASKQAIAESIAAYPASIGDKTATGVGTEIGSEMELVSGALEGLGDIDELGVVRAIADSARRIAIQRGEGAGPEVQAALLGGARRRSNQFVEDVELWADDFEAAGTPLSDLKPALRTVISGAMGDANFDELSPMYKALTVRLALEDLLRRSLD